MRYNEAHLVTALFRGKQDLRTASNRRNLRIRVHPNETRRALMTSITLRYSVEVGCEPTRGIVAFAGMLILGDESLPDDGTIVIETQDEIGPLSHRKTENIGYMTRMVLVVPIRPEET